MKRRKKKKKGTLWIFIFDFDPEWQTLQNINNTFITLRYFFSSLSLCLLFFLFAFYSGGFFFRFPHCVKSFEVFSLFILSLSRFSSSPSFFCPFLLHFFSFFFLFFLHRIVSLFFESQQNSEREKEGKTQNNKRKMI